jgi:hypothetical protein
MQKRKLGLLTGLRSIDLEKNHGIKYHVVYLLTTGRWEHYGVSCVNLSTCYELVSLLA